MKRSNSSSSSCDSSCIESNDPVQQQQQQQVDEVQLKKKNKRVRTKKNNNENENQIQENNNNNNSSEIIKNGGNKRSSIYRGVTRHRWTGRFEAHLWDKDTWNTIQNKKGRQIYLGAYDNEEGAARTYDLAALKYWGPGIVLNFPVETYTKELEEMQKLSKEEYLASLRRTSSGFSRGVSKYRGVARHHHNGRWEARIGRVMGNKYLYLGTYSTQEEAAAAYDMAAIEYRGPNAVTNFDISNYIDKTKKLKSPNEIKTEAPEESPVEEQQQVELRTQGTPEESSVEEQQSVELLKEETPVEEIPHEMIKQEAFDEFFTAEQLFMVHDDYQQYQLEEKQLFPATVPDLEFGHSVGSQTMGVMNPEDQHANPWDLCLDIGFHSLDIPHDEKHSELPDLFNDIDFDGELDLMFDGEYYGIDLNQDPMPSDIGFDLEGEVEGEVQADLLVVKEEIGVEASTSSPSFSTPFSTTIIFSQKGLEASTSSPSLSSTLSTTTTVSGDV